MKKLSRLFVLSILVCALSIPGFSQMYLKKILDRGELRVGMTATQPPYCIKDKTGKIIGYEAELAEILAREMELKLTIVEIPFAELLQSLEDGKVDMVMSGMTITTKRNMKTIFAGPHIISGKSILTKSLAFSDTDEPEDLNDGTVKIAVLKGSNSEVFVKKEIPEAKVVLGNDYDECVKLLEKGLVNLMVADYSMCAYIAQIYPEKGLITIDKPMSIEPIGIALPQDAAHFTNLVENYLNLLLVTGTLDEMHNYWFDSGEWVDSVK